MPSISLSGIVVPYQNEVVNKTGFLSVAWTSFFRQVQTTLAPIGTETHFSLANNQSSPADIVGMQFDYRKVNQATIEYVIQRITTGTGATELVATGIFLITYKPVAGTWHIVTIGTPGPSTSGITFSITTGGQVQYTSTNITGTANISKITYRARTLAAKVAT